jgi:hypothetical protein
MAIPMVLVSKSLELQLLFFKKKIYHLPSSNFKNNKSNLGLYIILRSIGNQVKGLELQTPCSQGQKAYKKPNTFIIQDSGDLVDADIIHSGALYFLETNESTFHCHKETTSCYRLVS